MDNEYFEEEVRPEKIMVVMVRPGEYARIEEIGTTLEDLQEAVGGFIETYYPFDYNDDGTMEVIVCNDEGKISGMPLNRAILDDEGRIMDVIAGPFFICDSGTENFESLDQERLDKYVNMFRFPEVFYRDSKGNIFAESYHPTETER